MDLERPPLGRPGRPVRLRPPFHDVERMNRHLLREWTSRVRSDDTIIWVGDVAHPDAWDDRRLVLDIRNCPGERVLILGNHAAGFTTQYSLAVCATDPPLVLSHYPLHHLPVGATNVHGHLHNRFEPTAWHINLAVEGTGYSPVGLVWVLDKARRRRATLRLSPVPGGLAPAWAVLRGGQPRRISGLIAAGPATRPCERRSSTRTPKLGHRRRASGWTTSPRGWRRWFDRVCADSGLSRRQPTLAAHSSRAFAYA